jgi:hypothetical protein
VQRSAEDPSILVAIYEGEHNHMNPSCQTEISLGSSQCANLGSVHISSSMRSSSPTVTLDLIQPGLCGAKNSIQEVESPPLQQFLVQQMASSLTRDPNFTAALAAAISGRIYDSTTLWIENLCCLGNIGEFSYIYCKLKLESSGEREKKKCA